VALQIGGVGQDQIGIGHHFRGIGVGIDDLRDHVVAVLVLVGQHLHGPRVFIDEFQAMLAM
jgi:hypothetical protein